MRRRVRGILSFLLGCAMTDLPPGLLEKLEKLGVQETPRILVVSVAAQKMTLFGGRQPKSEYSISTARKGTGCRANSFQTPLGLHRIREKLGKDVPQGAIFDSRELTGKIWTPAPAPDAPPESSAESAVGPVKPSATACDLITSRILWLEGLEPGINAGRDAEGALVDSHERYIYIHGTNHEDEIGKAASHGCIRMLNAEVITLFDQVQEADLVWVQE